MCRFLFAALFVALVAANAAADPEGLVTKPGKYPG